MDSVAQLGRCSCCSSHLRQSLSSPSSPLPLCPSSCRHVFALGVCQKHSKEKKKNMIAMLEWIHLRSYDSPACLPAWNWHRRFTTHSLTHSLSQHSHRRLGLRFCLTSFAVVVVIKVFFCTIYLRTLCVLVSVSISIFCCFSFHYDFMWCALDSNPT